MNLDNIEKLARLIEMQPDVKMSDSAGFCMRVYRHPCGTPGCIKGWSNHLFGVGMRHALKISYINDDDEIELICPDNSYADYSETNPNMRKFISSKRAARVLRNLAKTNEVDWSIR